MGEADKTAGGDEERPSEDGTRRRFLQALGATSAIAGVGLGGAQETTEGGAQETTEGPRQETTTEGTRQETQTTGTEPTPVVLGGRTAYWLGLAPAPIEGGRNPTLQLRSGEQYRLVWTNLDGERHRWRIEDEEGTAIQRTDPASRVGETRSVTFEATDAMARYRCEFHPDRMRGSVELGEGFETTTAGEDTTVEGDETTDGGGETTTDDEATTADEGGEATTAGGGETVDVAVGPEGNYLKFVPETVEISVGDTVRWTAESEGHNVTAKSEASTKVEIPDGAEPFATYEGNRSFMVMQVGETFEHTFTVPGTYVYVCAPHSDQGMVARVIVSE